MKHLAAYLLLTLGGNEKPSAGDIKKVLDSVGIEADSDRLDKLISELEGKDINTVRLRTNEHAPQRYRPFPAWTEDNADDSCCTVDLRG